MSVQQSHGISAAVMAATHVSAAQTPSVAKVSEFTVNDFKGYYENPIDYAVAKSSIQYALSESAITGDFKDFTANTSQKARSEPQSAKHQSIDEQVSYNPAAEIPDHEHHVHHTVASVLPAMDTMTNQNVQNNLDNKSIEGNKVLLQEHEANFHHLYKEIEKDKPEKKSKVEVENDTFEQYSNSERHAERDDMTMHDAHNHLHKMKHNGKDVFEESIDESVNRVFSAKRFEDEQTERVAAPEFLSAPTIPAFDDGNYYSDLITRSRGIEVVYHSFCKFIFRLGA